MYKILSIDFDWILSPNQWLELNKLILNKVDDAKVLGFIKQHHHILHYIQPQTHLTNIDHHHDVFYKQHFNNVINEGNWVNFCIQTKKIIGYNWIGNTKSDLVEADLGMLRELEFFDRDITLEGIQDQKFDAIIFVESFGYRYENKNEHSMEFFIPWRLTKQYIEKYHPEKIVEYKTNHITKFFDNV